MLFPELRGSGLIGIARLAAESEVLEAKRRVQYFELETRKWITRPTGRPMPFDWMVNPYRGCEFGCKYCYARYTHEFMELRETEQFETMIFAKHFSADTFRRELRRVPLGECIAIGTATDPYQPVERRYRITRRILAVLAGEQGRRFSIATKSDLVARDAELLGAIARRNWLYVSMTITTVDERLARVLEPYAPRPSLRLEAVRQLTAAGVRVGILCCPVMPLINDSRASLGEVARRGAEAGASSLHGNPLFLKPCAQKAFFPMLEREFPHLVRRYRERYEKKHFLEGPYVEALQKRVHEIRAEHGLTERGYNYQPELWAGEAQLDLFKEPAQASPGELCGQECG